MAPKKSSKSSSTKKQPANSAASELSKPFKKAPEVLDSFYNSLSEKHIYITHIDSKPREFKQKIFSVPVALNIAIVLLAIWRTQYIAPYYLAILSSLQGTPNETTIATAELSWGVLTRLIFRRGFTFLLDFVLVVFVWPWPLDFCYGRAHGSPVQWRWAIGFRDREVYVRRSRAWDEQLRDGIMRSKESDAGRLLFQQYVEHATSPMLLNEKTGYLTMNAYWDLDWASMVLATKLVDKKDVALDAFKLLVLFHDKEHGWVSLDLKETAHAQDDERRNQIYAFREALSAIGKEDLFFRWIEIVQFESSQPGGFGPEKQVEVAKKIRDLFEAQGIDFDEFWKSSVDSSTVLE